MVNSTTLVILVKPCASSNFVILFALVGFMVVVAVEPEPVKEHQFLRLKIKLCKGTIYIAVID